MAAGPSPQPDQSNAPAYSSNGLMVLPSTMR
jgi:hypothetical protein